MMKMLARPIRNTETANRLKDTMSFVVTFNFFMVSLLFVLDVECIQ